VIRNWNEKRGKGEGTPSYSISTYFILYPKSHTHSNQSRVLMYKDGQHVMTTFTLFIIVMVTYSTALRTWYSLIWSSRLKDWRHQPSPSFRYARARYRRERTKKEQEGKTYYDDDANLDIKIVRRIGWNEKI
jgi:hypothetical protein